MFETGRTYKFVVSQPNGKSSVYTGIVLEESGGAIKIQDRDGIVRGFNIQTLLKWVEIGGDLDG